MYEVLVGPVVTYALENEEALGSFERRILSCIFGTVQEGGKWRRRYNSEICKLYSEIDLVKHRMNRLQLAGQLTSVHDEEIPKKNIHCHARRERWD